jgi:hypothetical protein
MLFLLLAPFVLQALLIFLDEGVFHLKRGLPRWERIGHPLDTLSVLVCFATVLWAPFSSGFLLLYLTLAAFSCFLITKDEFVHKEVCCAKEQWLHAALFVNHSILLLSCCLIWWILSDAPPAWSHPLLTHRSTLTLFLKGQTGFIFLFCLYQTLYWNFIWKEKKEM